MRRQHHVSPATPTKSSWPRAWSARITRPEPGSRKREKLSFRTSPNFRALEWDCCGYSLSRAWHCCANSVLATPGPVPLRRLRALPRAPVSTTLNLDELSPGLRSDPFTVGERAAPAFVSQRRTLAGLLHDLSATASIPTCRAAVAGIFERMAFVGTAAEA